MGLCNSCFTSDLLSTSLESTPFHSLDKVNQKCVVLDCYDGDTCIIALHIDRHKINLFKCRLIGIDTPEMKGGDKCRAMEARDFLINSVSLQPIKSNSTRREAQVHLSTFKRVVRVECGEWDKYGRLLIKLFVQQGVKEKCINEELIKEGHAKKYDGGTKEAW